MAFPVHSISPPHIAYCTVLGDTSVAVPLMRILAPIAHLWSGTGISKRPVAWIFRSCWFYDLVPPFDRFHTRCFHLAGCDVWGVNLLLWIPLITDVAGNGGFKSGGYAVIGAPGGRFYVWRYWLNAAVLWRGNLYERAGQPSQPGL
jgi:hypothetical protein